MIVINLYGSPGAGKSTVRADLFSRLKRKGINCEEVSEFAKQCTWQKRGLTLACQPYLFGKQLHETVVLDGQVDVVITDSPLILCCHYGRKSSVNYPESFYQSIIDISNQMDTMDYFLRRVHPYNPSGRNQTEEQSNAVADDLIDILHQAGVEYQMIDGDDQAAEIIAQHVLERLKNDERKVASNV